MKRLLPPTRYVVTGFCLGLFLITLLTAGLCQAHKVNVFAYAEGDLIKGETSFSGGRPAKNAVINVEDESNGTLILSIRTDEQGTFSFPIPVQAREQRLNLRLVLVAGEAHQNDWLIKADEYLPAPLASAAISPPAVLPPPTDTQQPVTATTLQNNEALRTIVEEVLEAKIAPLRKMILESQQTGPRLQDILGGIGYIVGFFGLIAWFKAKNKGE